MRKHLKIKKVQYIETKNGEHINCIYRLQATD